MKTQKLCLLFASLMSIQVMTMLRKSTVTNLNRSVAPTGSAVLSSVPVRSDIQRNFTATYPETTRVSYNNGPWQERTSFRTVPLSERLADLTNQKASNEQGMADMTSRLRSADRVDYFAEGFSPVEARNRAMDEYREAWSRYHTSLRGVNKEFDKLANELLQNKSADDWRKFADALEESGMAEAAKTARAISMHKEEMERSAKRIDSYNSKREDSNSILTPSVLERSEAMKDKNRTLDNAISHQEKVYSAHEDRAKKIIKDDLSQEFLEAETKSKDKKPLSEIHEDIIR